MRKLLPIALALLLPAARLQAQFAYGSPEAAVASALQADSLHDWQRLLSLVLPDELRKWRDREALGMQRDFPFGLMGMDSCVTAALARKARFTLDSVFRVPTPDSLARTRPDTLFARAHTWAQRASYWAPRPQRPLERMPAQRILGTVLASDTLGWVGILNHYDDPPTPDWPVDRLETIEVQRLDGRWRVALDADLADLGSSELMFLGSDCRRPE